MTGPRGARTEGTATGPEDGPDREASRGRPDPGARGVRARRITPADAKVVQAILAGGADRTLPRRTRQTARQRAYERQWIVDRYVPDFPALGRPVLTFALAQPYLESAWSTVHRWKRRGENVLLWAGSESVFGVFASEEGPPTERLARALSAPPRHRTDFLLSVDVRRPTVPIYFDFEAAWGRAVGLEGNLSYPQPLPGARTPDGEVPMTPQERGAAVRWLARPFVPDESAAGSGLERWIFGDRIARRLLKHRRFERRSFLNPIAVAQWIGGFPTHVAFVCGTLRPGASAEGLFRSLLGGCDLRPFLFATDGQAILMANLLDPSVRGAGAGGRGDPVLPTLREWLAEIAVVREPLAGIEALADHRYDQPFNGPREPAGESPPGVSVALRDPDPSPPAAAQGRASRRPPTVSSDPHRASLGPAAAPASRRAPE